MNEGGYPTVASAPGVDAKTVVVGGVPVGRDAFTLIAGPCAIESEEQALAAARMAARAGASILRGGAFKPRTSPHSFEGLERRGLEILATCRDETGLPVVTEVLDARDVELVASYADCLQVGSRNMQNFTLLKELGRAGVPVLLKRGMAATVDEWLSAAEHIAGEGNDDIVLCERGIRTFEPSTRNTIDIGGMVFARERSRLPVIADPSHASGSRKLVAPLAMAAVAAGCDGLMVDVHPRPEEALCDGPQALTADDLDLLAADVRTLLVAMGRRQTSPAATASSGRPPFVAG